MEIKLSYWLVAFRPKTLTAALVPILVATALVASQTQNVQWWISGMALLASLCIQIGTNLVNDAADFKKGADTIDRLGPQRVTQAGLFSARRVLIVAAGFFVLAAICGIPLVAKGGAVIVVVGLLSILMGYAYTAGPFPLAYLGLGDLFVILFFGFVAVGGMAFLHQGRLSSADLVLGFQIGLLCAALIAINNLRDIDGDTKADKKTLPVRFGKKFARIEIAVLVFLPFILNIYWILNGQKWAGILPFLMLPLGANLVKLVFKIEPSRVYNKFLGKAAALHLGFGLLFVVGILL